MARAAGALRTAEEGGAAALARPGQPARPRRPMPARLTQTAPGGTAPRPTAPTVVVDLEAATLPRPRRPATPAGLTRTAPGAEEEAMRRRRRRRTACPLRQPCPCTAAVRRRPQAAMAATEAVEVQLSSTAATARPTRAHPHRHRRCRLPEVASTVATEVMAARPRRREERTATAAGARREAERAIRPNDLPRPPCSFSRPARPLCNPQNSLTVRLVGL